MKRVYIVGAEVHICEIEQLEANQHSFGAVTVTDHPVVPAGTKLRIPRAGTTSFDIEDDQVASVQQKVDEWKRPLLTVASGNPNPPEPKKPATKTPAAKGTGTRRIGGK